MNDMDFEKYLSERYEDQINWYDAKSQWNQRWYKWLQTLLIIFSSITPKVSTVTVK